ncbi:hypothetical protein WA026_015858 [Henosepilachna vigintioctopunctata]|uniref:Testicular haploid expressed protein n=1 Tax=Henosepilachna vigintioctopunctata TaxID=420089 RepID=A0AAW1UU25_9CUCU
MVEIRSVNPDANAKAPYITNEKKSEHKVNKVHKFRLKGIWRETQLAKPKMPQGKYVPPYDGPLKLVQKSLIIDPDILTRCDQLAFAHLRTTQDNKRAFKNFVDTRKMKNFTKNEEKILNSIYFLYRKNQTIKRQKQLKLEKRKLRRSKSSRKKVKEKEEDRILRITKLVSPKKEHPLDPIDRGIWRPLDQLTRYMELAEPVKRKDLPFKSAYEINPAALTYVATDTIVRLAQLPRRYESIEPPLEATRPVPRSALTYQMTPQMEKLYTVKVRKEGNTPISEDDVWKISPAALTYKATPRILQLAKHTERK